MHDHGSLTPITPAERAWLRAVFAGRHVPSEGIDVHHLLRVTQEHGIQPLLFSVIWRSPYPPELVDGLRREAFRQSVVSEQRARRVQVVQKALSAAGVVPLWIKAAALDEIVYRSADLRPRADTDLVVDAGEADRCVEALRQLGYAAEGSPREAPSNQLILRGADPSDILDLHWAISNARQFARLFNVDALRAGGMTSSRGLLVPSLIDSLLIACIHRVAHHYGSERLIWLADIVLLWEALRDDQRQQFWGRAEEARVVTVCADGLARAFEWFREGESAPRPPARGGVARQTKEASARSLDPGRLRVSQLASDLGSSRSLGDSLVFMRRLAFPPPAQLRRRYPGSRAPLPLLYMWRGMRGLARLFNRLRE